MAAALYRLRGMLHSFVDDGGLYSSYNGEQPYQTVKSLPSLKHVANGAKRSRRLAFHKA